MEVTQVTFLQTQGDEDRLVAAGHGNGLDVWDRATERRVQRMNVGRTHSVWFSRDGTKLLTSGGNGVRRWRIEPGNVTPQGDPEVLLSLPSERMSVVRDGKLLAVHQGISQVVLLSAERALDGPLELPRRMLPGPWGLDHAVLSPDGKWLATSTWQGRPVAMCKSEISWRSSGSWRRFGCRTADALAMTQTRSVASDPQSAVSDQQVSGLQNKLAWGEEWPPCRGLIFCSSGLELVTYFISE